MKITRGEFREMIKRAYEHVKGDGSWDDLDVPEQNKIIASHAERHADFLEFIDRKERTNCTK